jgi:putative membrane protein
MKKLVILSATFLAVWMTQSCGNNAKNPQSETPVDSAQNINETVKPVDEKSSEFAVDAANAGMKEVAMGKLAQEKGQSERVKAFGTMMVNDHTKTADELKALAAKKSITLPAELSTDDKKHMDDMAKKTGKDFDKHYIDMMVDGHKDVVSKFEKASDNVTDEELKTWARNTLPTLKAHLDSAQAIKDSWKK